MNTSNTLTTRPSGIDAAGLLSHDGPDFVRLLYRELLGREVDPGGMEFYVGQLENGVPKSSVILQICEGAEYRQKGRKLPGLQSQLRRYRWRRWLVQRLFGSELPLAARPAPAKATGALAPAALAQVTELNERLGALEGLLREAAGDAIEKRVHKQLSNFNAQKYLEHNPDVQAAGMNPYEHWVVAGHKEGRGWGQPAAAESQARLAPVQAPLKLPDGSWEWEEHDGVLGRFRAERERRRQTFRPVPAKLIHIGDTDIGRAIADLALPAPPEQPEVTIIIPVYNHLALTLECLASIAANTSGRSYEVLVTDDASEESVSTLLRAVPNLRYRCNATNQGFLRNCNAAIAEARGHWVVFLNNDVQVPAGWLEALCNAFELTPRVGITGPAFVYPSGHLQEAGGSLRQDGRGVMVGLNDDPHKAAYAFPRRVDYVSGACLMIRRDLLLELGGFSEKYLPCYCEDSDLCLRVQQAGWDVVVDPRVHVVHHLSKTTAAVDNEFKMRAATRNIATLTQQHADWLARRTPRVIAFYLPQFHPFPENNAWWGEGFTEWTNVSKAQPNFEGHYQPRLPKDLGYYDLRLNEVMQKQAELARKGGVDGFCFYYYWFGGKRLLEQPIELMLKKGEPDFPFCLCWANENWSRRWDGNDRDLLISQAHSDEDDIRVIEDLSRYFVDQRYIRVDGKPLLVIYRVGLFPDFAATAARWRQHCRETGIGEIYIAMVESFEMVHAKVHPSKYGCDASLEFPPQGLAKLGPAPTELLNPSYTGVVGDYRELAVSYGTREEPGYTRFKAVMPGWDNTARRQNDGTVFIDNTPGAFQAWLEDSLEYAMNHQYGDERLVFVNAWNEWAEGAYLEPDRRFGHAFLDAVANAKSAALLRANAPSV